MSCGEPSFWGQIQKSNEEQMELSHANPFADAYKEAEMSVDYGTSCMAEEMAAVIDQDILSKIRQEIGEEQYKEMVDAIHATPLIPEHLADQAYVDARVSKSYVDNNASPGDLMYNSEADQMMVYDGSGNQQWLTMASPITPEPNGMVGALVVQTPAGEELDVCSTIIKMEERIKELEREVLGHKINKLSDEIDEDLAYFRSKVERGLEPAKKRLAFDNAMKGV